MNATHDVTTCSVAASAEIIGAKWTALLVHDLSEGPRRFSELEHSCVGISPRTLAERLRALEAEGIVIHTPNQGVRVADVTAESLDDLREVYVIRRSLERVATETAHANVSRAQLAQLNELHEALREACNGGDEQQIRILNYLFHMRLYGHAHMPRLLRMIQTLWTLFPWDSLRLGRSPDRSLAEHTAVLEALATGTATEAGERMAEHIGHGFEAVLQHVTDQDGGSMDGAR
jgi:DNA-binding GntR family transcriptional regulator